MGVYKPRAGKEMNRKLVLGCIYDSDTASIADVAVQVGLSKTTASKIIRHFMKLGLVKSVGKGSSTEEGGKKPELFKLNERAGYAVAIHMLDTRLDAVIAGLDGVEIGYATATLAAGEPGESIARKMGEIYAQLLERAEGVSERIIGIAVGAHGIVDFDTGTILTSPHFPQLSDFPLSKELRRYLPGNVPLYIDNQIRFQTFAEASRGVGKGCGDLIAVESREGFVAGIVSGKSIHRGTHYLAGEVGHMKVNPDSAIRCHCGSTGCLEQELSHKRLMELIEQARLDVPNAELFRSNAVLSADAVFSAANEGDVTARSILDRIAAWYGLGLSNIVLAVDPELVVIQGLYARAGWYFMAQLEKELNRPPLARLSRRVRLAYSLLGDNVGVIGEISFVIDEFLALRQGVD